MHSIASLAQDFTGLIMSRQKELGCSDPLLDQVLPLEECEKVLHKFGFCYMKWGMGSGKNIWRTVHGALCFREVHRTGDIVEHNHSVLQRGMQVHVWEYDPCPLAQKQE
jgi:hypothetical protein